MKKGSKWTNTCLQWSAIKIPLHDLIKGKKTTWTNTRLQRLYQHYNHRFWAGKLPVYSVVQEPLEADGGWTNRDELLICVDTDKYASDRAVRSVLLHEMCHVAAGEGGHGSAFYIQLEHLLRMKAPIIAGRSEAPFPFYYRVPANYRLSYAAISRAKRRELRVLERSCPLNIKDAPPYPITGELENEFALDFYKAGLYGFFWEDALCLVGAEWEILGTDNQPLPEYRDLIKAAKKAHRRGEREGRILQMEPDFDPRLSRR
jgi:hypothetical protein